MAKPTVFLIHGMWSFAAVWDAIRGRLDAAGFTTYAAKLPGHDGVPGDLSVLGLRDYVDALEAQALPFGEDIVIIGHSMGGLMAQLLASRICCKKLVLLSTAPSSGIFAAQPSALRTTWPVISRWGYWRRPTIMTRAAALYGIFNNVPSEEAEAAIAMLVPDSGRVMFEIGMPYLDRAQASRVDYNKLKMPSLVIVGADDRITAPSVSRATAQKISGPVSFEMLPGFGHWTLGSQGAPILCEKIASFLSDV